MPRPNPIALGLMLTLLLAPVASGHWFEQQQVCCDNCDPSGQAGPCKRCYRELEQQREENNLWPQQYVGLDRCRAKSPFDTMVRNGWRRQNLIGAHHFNDDSTSLTDSGKLRVQWALTQAPLERRQVFVERSFSETVSHRRLEVVQQFANDVVGEKGESLVADTHIVSDGRPATIVDYVNTSFQENMPIPTLPESSYEGESE